MGKPAVTKELVQMNREQIEATPWATAFKLDSPVSYEQAIQYALEPGLKVETELQLIGPGGEKLWAILVFDAPRFIMNMAGSKREAADFCKAMGWRVQ